MPTVTKMKDFKDVMVLVVDNASVVVLVEAIGLLKQGHAVWWCWRGGRER